MDMSFIKSPWVIAAGIGAGVLMLVSRGGNSNSGVDYNRASLDLIAMQSQLAADVDKTRIAAGAALSTQIAETIGNLVNANYAHDLGVKQIDAGITSTRLASNAAYKIEKLTARSRNKEIAAGLNIAKFTGRLSLKSDRLHSKSDWRIAKLGAKTSLASQKLQSNTALAMQSASYAPSYVAGGGGDGGSIFSDFVGVVRSLLGGENTTGEIAA